MKPELLLFDLGGVVVEFSGLRDIAALMREPVDEESARERWLACACIRDFEVGALTPDEFAQRFHREWELAVSPGEFLQHFEGWNRGFMPGASELLGTLGQRYRVAALSNSNERHWCQNQRDFEIQRYFERAFSSHELGFHKPDARIYRAALEALRIAPERVLFLDDNQINVDGARAVGMQAELVRGVDATRERLVELAIL